MTDLSMPARRPTHACDLVKEGPGLTCPAGLPVPRGTVLTRHMLRSVAALVLLALLVTGANLLWTAHEVQVNNRARCDTVLATATIPLPAGGPARQWAAAFEAIQQARARQLGCKP